MKVRQRRVRWEPRFLLILHACVLSSQLIDYGKLGDTNERAMRMADFWLTVSAPYLLVRKESLENRLPGRFKAGHSLMYQSCELP